jgi:nucleotide-binding universal stress UspA family protein
MFKQILVGVDGSADALEAARLAGKLARQMGSHVIAVAAFEPIPDYLGKPYWEEAAAARMSKAQEILEQATTAIGEVPGGLETEMIEGRPADAILDVAQTRQVDLIVMGARGNHALSGLLLGSQSHKVLNKAPCPVLIARP